MPDSRNSVDGELLTRFRAGDREAFTLIYRMYSPAVFRFSLHMSCDHIKATETTQDVFVWLVHHPDGFDPSRGELGAFLIGVARKFLLRLWRNERRQLARRIPLDEAEAGVDSVGWSGTTEAESQVARLREFVAALPARYREVVVLCDLEGHTYEAAAGVLECAVGTVRSRLHRARELLARKLQAVKETQGCSV